jgi:hypothetical protein
VHVRGRQRPKRLRFWHSDQVRRFAPFLSVILIVPMITGASAVSQPFRYEKGWALNNRHLTPGAVLTTSTSRVCSKGYSATVRSVSDATKGKVYAAYGITGDRAYQYEVDRLIPLELGGSNDVKNLWPEPNDHPRGNTKDSLENRLHSLVCSGKVNLTAAQHAIASNWVRAYKRYFGPLGKGHDPRGISASSPSPRSQTESAAVPGSPIESAAVPALTPSAPTHLVAQSGNEAAVISWSPPADSGGGVKSYTVELTEQSTPTRQDLKATDLTCADPCPSLSWTTVNLLPSATYVVSVAAVNTAGPGPAATVLVKTVSALPSARDPLDPEGRKGLEVVGNQIDDQDGHHVVLKGISYDGSQKAFANTGNQAGLPENGEIDRMRLWGANTLRLPLSEDLWNRSCAGESAFYDVDYRARIQRVVEWATSHNMFVQLELSFTNPNCTKRGATVGPNGGTALALPGRGAIQFWKDLAATYKSNRLVGFELYNEPHVCSASSSKNLADGKAGKGCSDLNSENLWLKGGSVNDTTVYTGVGMLDMYNAIRYKVDSTGRLAISSGNIVPNANNLVIVESNSYAGDTSSYSLFINAINSEGSDATHIVQATHYYPCQSLTCAHLNEPRFLMATDASAADFPSSYAESCPFVVNHFGVWLREVDADHHPVLINEFGWPDPAEVTATDVAGNYLPNEMNYVIDYLDSKGIGWSSFSWHGHGYDDDTKNGIDTSWDLVKTPTFQPLGQDATSSGKAVESAMQGSLVGGCADRPVPPGTPGSPTLTSGDQTSNASHNALTATWQPPWDAFSGVTQYRVSVEVYVNKDNKPSYGLVGTPIVVSSAACPKSGSTCTLAFEEAPGQYRVSVQAVNSLGTDSFGNDIPGVSAPALPPTSQWRVAPS